MSKQDGYSSRTAEDVERKYNFGKTFAEVYNLISDAQKAAKEAQNAFDGLTKDEIFNLLTDFGKSQGVYRDELGNVYMNASYIKSGKLAAEYIDAENLNVAAANITGQLVATQIDTKDLKVLAANITGKLTAGQIDATYLEVDAANITGTLVAEQIDTTYLELDAANINGRLTFGQLPSDVASTDDVTEYAAYAAETYIDEWLVSAPTIEGLTVAGGVFTDYEQEISLYLDKDASAGSYGMFLEDSYGDEIFSVWDSGEETAAFSAKGTAFLTVIGNIIYPQGIWDFSGATVRNIE